MILTPAMQSVALYAGLNGLILLWLAVHVTMVRGREKISIGDGGNPAMIRAMRGMANFIEFAPLILLQMALMALIGAPVWLIHVFGIALTFGRLAHGWHFSRDDAPGWQRGAGAGITFLLLAAGSLGLVGHGLFGIF
jgi:uncharacterized membrane protein YecN with MAPEG domain